MLIPALLVVGAVVGFASMTNRTTWVPTAGEITSGRAIASRKVQNHGRNGKAVLRRDAKFLANQQQVPVSDVTGGTRFAHLSTGLHWRIIEAIR